MTDNKFILVVRVGTAHTEYFTDDSGDYDNEFCRQVWAYHLYEVEVSKNLRAEMEKHCDGDEDYSSMVLFVLDAKTRHILIDYTEDWLPDYFKFMTDDEKKAFIEATTTAHKGVEERKEYALRVLEARLGELKEPDYADGQGGEPDAF